MKNSTELHPSLSAAPSDNLLWMDIPERPDYQIAVAPSPETEGMYRLIERRKPAVN